MRLKFTYMNFISKNHIQPDQHRDNALLNRGQMPLSLALDGDEC